VDGAVPHGRWFAWANYRVVPDNIPGIAVDGGRTRSLSIAGDCQKTEVTETTPYFPDPLSQNVQAAGTGSFTAEGHYKPVFDIPEMAPASSVLRAAWVWIDDATAP
jgi:hypothetical protein